MQKMGRRGHARAFRLQTTEKLLGITVSSTLLARTDEVIE
jgi:hypothetical protein